MKTDKAKKCLICNKLFKPDYYNQKYCCTDCSKEAIKLQSEKNRIKQEVINIKKLGDSYDKMPNKVMLKCATCGKSYSTYRSQIKHRGSSFCSNTCKIKGKRSKTAEKRTTDALWSEVVKLRAGNVCEYDGCGQTRYLNSHHIFSRTNFSTRWDLDNGICLCAKHHMLGNFSAHKAPLEFAEWLREKRGEEWYKELLKKTKKIEKNIDYEAIRKYLFTVKDTLKTKQ